MDDFTWNHEGPERDAIQRFINSAQSRISEYPGKLPFKAAAGHIVINWLRGLLDRKPSMEI